MGFSIYDRYITETISGATVPNAIATVNTAGGGLAEIWTDIAGTTPLTNPATADSAGRLTFYAAPGRYDVAVSYVGGSINYYDVLIAPDAFPVVSYGASFTLSASMAYQYNRISGAVSAVDITAPDDPSDAIPIGTVIEIRQQSAVVCTVVAAGSAVVNAPAGGTLQIGGVGATVALKKAASNEWDLIGQVVAV